MVNEVTESKNDLFATFGMLWLRSILLSHLTLGYE